MTVSFVSGDLFALGLPAVGHGCNTRGSMGGGVAATVRDLFPDLHAEYRRRCAAGEFALGDVFVWDAQVPVVYNLATQVERGADARIEAVTSTVAAALADVEHRGLPALGVPWIGAGLGGLYRDAVMDVLVAAGGASPAELVVVTFRPPARGGASG